MPCIFMLQTVHSVLKLFSTGKYFPHDEMYKVDNLFWQKCKEKSMTRFSGRLKKSFELLEGSYIVPKHLAINYSGANYKPGYEADFCGLGIQCQLSALSIVCVLLICKLLYYQLFLAQLYYSMFLFFVTCMWRIPQQSINVLI